MFPAGGVKPLRFPCKGFLAIMAPSGLLYPLALELGLFLCHGEGNPTLDLAGFGKWGQVSHEMMPWLKLGNRTKSIILLFLMP